MDAAGIRVLVVDDTVTYRRIVADALSAVPGVTVVGTAANGRIALNKIPLLRPDLLTLDLEMPEMDGLSLLGELRYSDWEVGVIVLSSANKEGANATMAALNLGALDFVPKPVGGNAEENIKVLQRELVPKMEAFARKRHIRDILHRRAPAPAAPGFQAVPPVDVFEQLRRSVGMPPAGKPSRVDAVGIGISTGGPNALNRMLPRLPADLPVPILIVQHMPPVFTRSLAEDLDKRCSLRVSEASDGQAVLPGHVLIAPGGRQMKVVSEDGLPVVRITDDPPENSCRPSVDYLFRSLARVYGPHAVGVIMTGMGSDGTLGCRQMKQRGASIIAQDEASCVVYGMPREPIEEGIVDVIAPLDRIAAEIARFVGKGVAACR